MKSTNYYNTLIEVADDCNEINGKKPLLRSNKQTIATIQFEVISKNPYQYTSDDILFLTHCIRKNIPKDIQLAERDSFFEKSQACLRSSPLPKQFGWGVHSNNDGKIALYDCSSDEYHRLQKADEIKTVKAMRSRKA